MAPTPPDPKQLFDSLDRSQPFQDTVRDFLHDPSSMQVNYGIAPTDYLGADLMIEHPLKSRFQAVPVAASASEYYEAIVVHENESDFYYDDADMGYVYNDNAEVPQPGIGPNTGTGEPAQLTEVPTSSVNPARPRTVAAGYDKHRKTLTVVFRDGTFYNYYEVNNLKWENFKKAYSKGEFILAYLDSHPRGVANVAHLAPGARETLYRLARTGQIMRKGLTAHQTSVAKQTKIRKAQIKRAAAKRAGVAAPHATYKPGNLGGSTRPKKP